MGKNFLGLDGLKHFWSKAKIWIINRITTEVTAKIAEVVAKAPEDLDTLREIADWIKSHANDAAAMNAEIKANTEAISGKADKNHTHIKSDITDFPTSLPANGGTADKAVSVVDYGDVSSTVKIGFHGPDLTADEVGYIAGYKADTSGYIKDVSKDVLQEWAGIGSLSSLNTTDKSNLVSAINEVWSGLGGNLGLTTDEMGIKWYSSNITSGSYTAPYYANGIWVIGSSDSGSGIKYSTDGKTWTSSNITSGYYKSPYYANGIWVIGGRNSSIKYSTDGKTWTSSNITSGYYESPYYANGIWVIGSGGSGIKYSTDGKTWTSSNITTGAYNSPYYANGIWVTGSYNNNGITYSTDGKTWTSSNITSGYYNSPYYANGIWVIGGSGIKYSTDGKTWTSSNITSGNYKSPYYANGIWVIGSGGSGITYSTDGKTWTSSNITSGSYTAPYYANGIWVIGSSYSDSGIAYSTDGKTWTSSNITSGYYNSPYYANGIWVIGSSDSGSGIKYSTFNSLNDLGSAFKGISELKSYTDDTFGTNITSILNGLSTVNTDDASSIYYKLMKLIYPVGSLYWSSKSTNPANLFGGTWVQIKDRFVLACGDTYKTVDETGGASTVTLSVSNMPSHTHSFTPSGKVSSHSHGLNGHSHSFSGSGTTGGMSANAMGNFQTVIRGVNVTATNDSNESSSMANNSKTWATGCFSRGASYSTYGMNFYTPDHGSPNSSPASIHINVSHTHSFSYSGTTGVASGNTASATPTFSGSAGTTGSNGSGTAFSILPPYVVKYCWERTA